MMQDARKGRIAGLLVLGLLLGMALMPLVPAGASDGTSSRAIVEDETAGGCATNDNPGCAQPLVPSGGGQQWVGGSIIDDGSDPFDVYVVAGADAGMVINLTIYLNGAVGDLQQVRLGLLGPTLNLVTDGDSMSRYGSLAALVVVSGDYYVRVEPLDDQSVAIPYVLSARSATPPVVDISGLGPGATISQGGTLDLAGPNTAAWYAVDLSAGPDVNDVLNVSATFDPTIAQMDLYVRDLRVEQETWWTNTSWNGEAAYGGSGPVEWAEAAASFDDRLYVSLIDFSGADAFNLDFARTTAPSDGDNSPATATPILRTPGQVQTVATGTLDWSYDKYDFYTIDLQAGEGLPVDFVLQGPTPGNYRINLLRENSSSGLLDFVYFAFGSGGTLSIAPTDLPAGTYFLRVMASVPFNASDLNQIGDWWTGRSHTDYTLVVDLPDRDSDPTVATDAPVNLTIPEDTVDTTVSVADLFVDVDVTDPELQDVLSYAIDLPPEHIEAEILSDAGSTLRLVPEADWNGETSVRLKAEDLYGGSVTYTLDLAVSYLNDAPVLVANPGTILAPFTVKGGEVNASVGPIHLATLFADVDLPYDDLLQYGATGTTAQASVQPIVSGSELTFGPATVPAPGDGPFTVPLTVTATDSFAVPISYTVNVTVLAPDGELLFNGTGTTVTVLEGGNLTLDLQALGLFVQTRNRSLTYTLLDVDSDNIDVAVTPGGIATIEAKGDFNDAIGVEVSVRASHTDSNLLQQADGTFSVIVAAVPDAPVITGHLPAGPDNGTVTLAEGQSLAFSAAVDDVDSATTLLHHQWFLDDDVVSISASGYTYEASYESAGTHHVRLHVVDETGLGADISWVIEVSPTNRRPTMSVESPSNGSTLDKGPAPLRVVVGDPDGDSLTLAVTDLDTGEALGGGSATGHNATTVEVPIPLKAGKTRHLHLVLTDSAGATTALDWSIAAKKKHKETPGFGTPAVLLSLLLALVVISRSRRRP